MGVEQIDTLGSYELLIELARGGMAELYLGRLRGVGGFEKLVAIKRILPHHAEDPLFRDMFLNEGRIAAQLSHQNICQVFQLDQQDGELYLVMEYLRGVPWDALIAEVPRDMTTLRLTAGVIAQACEGLHAAHALHDAAGHATPVIHRDVSPQNLFVTVDGVCKVLDFGVSKMTKDSTRTRTGVLKGKLPYMAPEQIQGEPLDPRADVFALGVLVWEALVGRSLFDRDTDFLVWKAITEEPIPPLAPHGYPASIDAVIGQALARPRDQRFPTARALAEALRAAAAPLGGAMLPAEIAQVLQARCGPALAARAQEIAARLAQPRPSASFLSVERQAGSTVNLRATDRGPVDRASDVALTHRLDRASSWVAERPSDPQLSGARASDAQLSMLRPAMRSRRPLVVAALAAVALVAGVIVVVQRDAPAATATPPDRAVAPVVAPALDAGVDAAPAPALDAGAAATSVDAAAAPAPSPPPERRPPPREGRPPKRRDAPAGVPF